MESMESFADLFEASFQRVNNGDILEGTILQVSGDTAVVDIGSYMDGILTQDELLYDGETWEQYPEGTRLTLMVKRVDTRNSQILLSKKEADKVVIWDELEEKKAEPATILVRVKSAVKGGLRIQSDSRKQGLRCCRCRRRTPNPWRWSSPRSEYRWWSRW